MLPLCSNLVNFYTVSHKTRYKISLIRATAQNPCIFYVQSACGCRHSAVICSISIPSPTKHGTKWAKSEPPHRIHAFLRSKCMWMSPLCNNMLNFSRKLSELGSRLDFGVQGLGRGVGAAAGQKWSFRVRRRAISLPHGFPVLSWRLDFVDRRGTWCMSPSPLSCDS